MNKLEHIATIDFCYWRLGKLNKQLSKHKSNIEMLVDKACGYNEVGEVKNEAITLLEQIIESKKAIGADYSGDSKFLVELKSKELYE
ncbi:hypothetical protein [Paraprevotella clara]|uniref:hypothetical protein n=1 Tax=Paraprevotella clara TaxID=454154 RepID=UPI0026706373|nr:hypothetical protein [Paraprevotella clara]